LVTFAQGRCVTETTVAVSWMKAFHAVQQASTIWS
jgi:hypothetical protein